MADADLDLSETGVASGRKSEVFTRSMAALRGDSELLSLLGEASRIRPALDDEDPDPALLVVECTVGGSDRTGQMERKRFTVDLVVMLSPSAIETADPNFMTSVADRAIDVLAGGIGGNFVFAGSTNDISRRRSTEANEPDALVQVGSSVQFRRGDAL